MARDLIAQPSTRVWSVWPVLGFSLLLILLPFMPKALPHAAELRPGWGVLLAALCLATWMKARHSPVNVGAASGTLVATALALLFLGAARPLLADFDLRAVSQRVSQAQAQHDVAFVGVYRGQFTWFGRLAQPLPALKPEEVRGWLLRHPDGLVVGEIKRLNDKPEVRAAAWTAPYRKRYFAGWTAASLANAPQAFAASQTNSEEGDDDSSSSP